MIRIAIAVGSTHPERRVGPVGASVAPAARRGAMSYRLLDDPHDGTRAPRRPRIGESAEPEPAKLARG